MTAKSPHNSSPRGAIVPENKAEFFKQTRKTLRRTSSSSPPPQKKTADFHHGHTVHPKKVTGTIFFLNSEKNRWNGMEPLLIQMITLPPRPPRHPPAHLHHHHNDHVPTHILHITLTPHSRHRLRRHHVNLHQHLFNQTEMNGITIRTE